MKPVFSQLNTIPKLGCCGMWAVPHLFSGWAREKVKTDKSRGLKAINGRFAHN
jgi:hypothetical protein